MQSVGRLSRNLSSETIVNAIARGFRTGYGKLNLKDALAASYEARKTEVQKQLNRANTKYEKLVGLAEVQEAQKKVKEAEFIFLEARTNERTVLRQMVETRDKLKHVREKLSHVDYSNPVYLQLASDQHELVSEEERQQRQLEEAEDHERDSFQNLSNSMRDSYEKERARVEKTKNWSIIGTVIGTIIGMMGSIYMNRVRTKDLMKAVTETKSKEDLTAKLDSLTNTSEEKQTAIIGALNTVSENLAEMSNAIQVQNLEVLSGFVTNPLAEQTPSTIQMPRATPQNPTQPAVPIQALTAEIEQYNDALKSLGNAVKALASAGSFSNGSESRGIEILLEKQTEVATSIQAKVDKMISATNRSTVTVSEQLEAISQKLSNLQLTEGSSSEVGSVIYELPQEFSVKPPEQNWPIGVKDAMLWGSILCCLYLFIKF